MKTNFFVGDTVGAGLLRTGTIMDIASIRGQRLALVEMERVCLDSLSWLISI